VAAFVAGQLTSLRASPLGRWLGTGPPTAPGLQVSLDEVVRRRGAVLFALDRAAHGRAADTVAHLVAQNLTEVYAGLRRTAVGGDGLAWFGQCETVDPRALAGLISVGADTGLATVLSTTSAAAVGRLAEQASVLVLHRLDDRALAGQLAWLTGRRLVAAGLPPAHPAPALAGWPEPARAPGAEGGGEPAAGVSAGPAAPLGAAWSPLVTGEDLCALGEGEFTLVPRADAGRVVPLAVSVPARIPARQLAPGPGLARDDGLATVPEGAPAGPGDFPITGDPPR
jgi:hypothetical protein